MPGKTVGISLGYGFAGNVSQNGPGQPVIESRLVADDSANIPFGAPVILNADNTVSFGGADLLPANFYGVAIARVKQTLTYPDSTDDEAGYYKPGEMCSIITQGTVSVKVGYATGSVQAGSGVYVRNAATGNYPGSVAGDFGGADDGADAELLSNAVWANGRVDANDIAELKLRFPNL